ncbi:Vacuolar protein-sorting-associated protein 33 [Paramarasmius palmivorus]|uniref:Vacuolar protein-sorting-associated protein 33 n=1 Tax=Paramarasmius palmivorus TaxID=297713 RepID=A0AAW0DED8_9AGAR
MSSEPPSDGEQGLDTNILREINRKALIDALNSVNGAKTLVLDANLAGPLSLVTEVAILKHHGVDKMFWLESGPLSVSTPNVVYLCRPMIKYVKIIADHIKRHAKESLRYNYTILLVPRTSSLVSRLLEEEGVLGDVTISSYNLQFIPLADDVISLEYDSAFKDIWVDGDETVIYDSAQALITVQKLFGIFPRILGKGDHAAGLNANAQRLVKLLTTYLPQSQKSSGPDTLSEISDKIDSLIVLDRRVDMITPLLTQLTYEGLIDELIGIRNAHVELPASIVSPPSAVASSSSTQQPGPSTSPTSTSIRKESKKKYHLSGSDALYNDLRDLNFSLVGRKLNQTAHRIDEDYKASRQAKTIPQLRDVVGKLGGLQSEHQSLRIHTGISELLVPLTRTEVFNKSLEIQQNLLASYNISEQLTAIEDLIAREADMDTVIRLVCLASVTAGGIKNKTLETIKREILQTYGYNFLPLLLSLSAPSLAILLPNPLPPATPQSVVASKYPFTSLRKSLRLLIDDDAESLSEVENDISFTYSGYAPISIRLVQCVAQKGGVLSNPAEKEKASQSANGHDTRVGAKVQAHPIVGWKGFEDILATIPGQTMDVSQKDPSGMSLTRPMDKTTTTVVFFLGGCTYTEIAALRWVARQNIAISQDEWVLLHDESSLDVTGAPSISEIHDIKDAPLITRKAFERLCQKHATQYGVFGKVISCRVSVMLENMFISNYPAVGSLQKPLSGLVLHFGEGGAGASPCEAAWLAVPNSPSIQTPSVTVYVSKSSLNTMKQVYASLIEKGNIKVAPLLFDEGDLDAQTFLSMMAVGSSDGAPLYIQILLSILRDLGEAFTFKSFMRELEKKKKDFNPNQLTGLEQRLSLLKGFMRSNSKLDARLEFSAGELTVIDLSDPFIDPASACGIFEVITRLFVRAKVDTGKVLVLDEAHKYLAIKQGSSPLAKSLLGLMRLQRHLAMRVIISTQEPTVVPPVVLDLCSVAILHRFSSPSWWEHLIKHVSADFSESDGFSEVVQLQTGQAMILTPSGLGTFPLGESDADDTVERFGRRYLLVKTRKRVTVDGGASVLVLGG